MRKGADTAAVIASVLRTATQQGADPLAVLVGIQQSGDPPPQLDLAGAWAHHRDPRVVPCPGPRYRVVVTDEGDQGTQVAFRPHR